jgi:hypothetical protein
MSAPPVSAGTRQAQDYLAAVEHELADLPVDDRSALLEDLALHLEALAAEDDDRSIEVRLGAPATYAAELRAAAGLPPRGAANRPAVPGVRERMDAVRASTAYRRALPVGREVVRLLVELRPAWWVLRGYLLVLVPCLLNPDFVRDFPVPAPLGSHFLGGLLVLAAVAASVALGRRTLPGRVRVLVVVAGAVLGLASTVAAANSWNGVTQDYAYDQPVYIPDPGVPTDEYPLVSRHGPVTNVLPYAADGSPLEDVLLFDQDGRPLQVGFQQWWDDGCARVLHQPVAEDGVAVPYSFPQAYVLDPLGLDLNGIPVEPGSCLTQLDRPEVPIPVFADEAATG